MKDRIVFAAALFLLVFNSLCLGYILAKPNISPLQNYKSMQADYQRCKANAPTGFDCVMVPMLVSEDYMRETK